MSMLEREAAPAVATVSSRAGLASSPSIDQRLLVPLQRTGCGCAGTCGSCGGPKDDQGSDAPTVMRLGSSAPTKPPPGARSRKPSPGLLQLQRKAGNRAVTRLVGGDAGRSPTRSGPAVDGTNPTFAAEPPVITDGEPARQGGEERAPADSAPPPAAPPPAAPPSGSGDGRHAGDPAADAPAGATRGEDGEITVARVGGTETTVQRDDEGGGVLGIITGRATSIVDSIRSRGRQIWSAVEATIAGLVQTVTRMAQAVTDRLARALSALRQQAEAMWSSLRDRVAAVGQSLQAGFDGLRSRLRTVWEQVKASASGLVETLRGAGGALIERIRGRVLAALGPRSTPGGTCTTSEAIDLAHAELPGDVDAAIADFAAQATGGLARLDGEGAGGEAQGRAGASALEAESTSAVAATDASAATANVTLDADAASLRGDADAGAEEVQTEADSAVTQGQQRVDDDTSGLDQEGRSSVGGLGGLISGLASALLGRARQVIAGVRDRVTGVVDGLRQRAGAVLSSLGKQLRSILQRVRSGVERVIDAVIALVRDVGAKIGATIKALRAAIDRIAGLLGQLAQGAARLWSELRSRVAAGWSRLRGAVASLRARAASLLPASHCTACEFRDAAKRADALASSGLDSLDIGSTVAGLAVALKRSGGATGTTLPPQAVVARLGRGRPLAGDVRGRMESGFGRSFDGVEVHTDDTAGRLAEEMGARAFTVGQHVGFGPAQYQPGTVVGDALLAHELAHVAQGSGRVATDRSDETAPGDRTPESAESAESAEEHDADETAIAVTARLWSGRTGDAIPIAAIARSGLAVRRCPKCCEITPPTGALKLVEAAHDCAPTLQSFDDAQASKQANKIEGEDDDRYSMGLTSLNMNTVKDAANLSATPNRKCDEQCDVSTDRLPAMSLSPFYAVKAGTFARPDPVTFGRKTKQNVPPACRGKQMKKSFRITQATSDQARAAEVEHCNDLKLGWNRSVAKYLGAAQELASGFCTPEGKKCEVQFNELVKARSGIDSPIPFMNCAQSVSMGRDEPDEHIFRAPRVVEVAKDCSEAIYEFPPLTKLGQKSSQEVIDVCGK